MTPPPAPRGLCGTCAFARVVTTSRGSAFVRCARAEEDPRYPKYPPLPVLACPGYVRETGAEPAGC
jgi:hypothetical protein